MPVFCHSARVRVCAVVTYKYSQRSCDEQDVRKAQAEAQAEAEALMAEYLLKGKKYTGPKHKMPNGKFHTGAKHTAASKPLTTKKKS